MSPCIVLWELPDRLICGDEEGRLVIFRRNRNPASQPVLSDRLRRIRGSAASIEFTLQPPGKEPLSVTLQHALVDGYLVRCTWIAELDTWIIAGEPQLLTSASN